MHLAYPRRPNVLGCSPFCTWLDARFTPTPYGTGTRTTFGPDLLAGPALVRSIEAGPYHVFILVLGPTSGSGRRTPLRADFVVFSRWALAAATSVLALSRRSPSLKPGTGGVVRSDQINIMLHDYLAIGPSGHPSPWIRWLLRRRLGEHVLPPARARGRRKPLAHA